MRRVIDEGDWTRTDGRCIGDCPANRVWGKSDGMIGPGTSDHSWLCCYHVQSILAQVPEPPVSFSPSLVAIAEIASLPHGISPQVTGFNPSGQLASLMRSSRWNIVHLCYKRQKKKIVLNLVSVEVMPMLGNESELHRRGSGMRRALLTPTRVRPPAHIIMGTVFHNSTLLVQSQLRNTFLRFAGKCAFSKDLEL